MSQQEAADAFYERNSVDNYIFCIYSGFFINIELACSVMDCIIHTVLYACRTTNIVLFYICFLSFYISVLTVPIFCAMVLCIDMAWYNLHCLSSKKTYNLDVYDEKVKVLTRNLNKIITVQ